MCVCMSEACLELILECEVCDITHCFDAQNCYNVDRSLV